MKKLRFDPLIAIFFFKSGVLCACVLSGATVTVCEWGGREINLTAAAHVSE